MNTQALVMTSGGMAFFVLLKYLFSLSLCYNMIFYFVFMTQSMLTTQEYCCCIPGDLWSTHTDAGTVLNTGLLQQNVCWWRVIAHKHGMTRRE